jgi:hypothetical protein
MSGRPRPTILLNNGFDGSAEEMHWNGARAAVERSYRRARPVRPGAPGEASLPPQLREGGYVRRQICFQVR